MAVGSNGMYVIAEPQQISEKSVETNEGYFVDVNYLVNFYGPWDSVGLVDNAASISLPIYGDYLETGYLGSSSSFVSNISADLDSGSKISPSSTQSGLAIYAIKITPVTAERLDLAPTSRPAIISGSGIELTEVRNVDINGNLIANSAGDVYSDLPSFYVPGGEISIEINLASNPATTCKTYSFSVNNGTWNGVAAGQGVMGKITFREVIEIWAGSQITYYKTNFPMRFRSDGNSWQFLPIDYGWNYVKSGAHVPNVVNGVASPALLDGSGGLLAYGGTPVVYPTDGYETLVPQDWSSLSLPNPF